MAKIIKKVQNSLLSIMQHVGILDHLSIYNISHRLETRLEICYRSPGLLTNIMFEIQYDDTHLQCFCNLPIINVFVNIKERETTPLQSQNALVLHLNPLENMSKQ